MEWEKKSTIELILVHHTLSLLLQQLLCPSSSLRFIPRLFRECRDGKIEAHTATLCNILFSRLYGLIWKATRLLFLSFINYITPNIVLSKGFGHDHLHSCLSIAAFLLKRTKVMVQYVMITQKKDCKIYSCSELGFYTS